MPSRTRLMSVQSLSAYLMVAAVWLLAACGVVGEEKPIGFRYRLTIEVETPEGLKTGSSVIEVAGTVAKPGTVIVTGPVRKRARGEAVAVDLPGGQTLFALLRSENEIDWATNIIFLHSAKYRGKDSFETTVREIRRNKRLRVLPPVKRVADGRMKRDGWPMLVMFDDLSDPTSVRKVDPSDLGATFGEGVSLKRITAQVTEDPVTTGILERLPRSLERGFYGLQTEIDGVQHVVRLGRSAFSKGIAE